MGEGTKARIITGSLPEEVMDELDLVVISPGVPTDLPVVQKMREKKIEIMGEIELAYLCGKGEVLAITGTNGKTTTTALLGEIMKNASDSAFVVGNIGNPYTTVAEDTREDSVIVAEMSSFQLETIHTFRPRVIGHFEFDAGPFRQASYHGGIYSGKDEYCLEPDGRRFLHLKL